MKVGIITITSGNNYGNRLQNYAVQTILEKKGITTNTIRNYGDSKSIIIKKLYIMLKNIVKKTIFNKKYKYTFLRTRKFKKFNKKYIKFKYKISNKNIPFQINEKYDKFICGSDQIWNPNYNENAEVNFLQFTPKEKRVAFAPSFGASNIPQNRKEKFKSWINSIDFLSVREDAGKKIIEELTKRKDVEVLVDPTMLLTSEEWDKIAEKPEQLKSKRYILTYFLGEFTDERREEINRIAKENDCEVISIMDVNSPFYQTGPSEFLYLEKNAFLICTDSFHSCVFAMIYDRPFIVFDRKDSTISMNSRIDTLLSKFNLKNRKYDGKISLENIQHDYTEAFKILEYEKNKSDIFLKKALNIGE